MSEKRNLLILISDEHSGACTGYGGHPIVKTPNLDALAARGVQFSNAYTNCPICIPARASMATGRYVHQIGAWDNAMPYAGEPQGWGHALQAGGTPVQSIGKLHYKDSTVSTGFDAQIVPMHAARGIGDVMGSIREPKMPQRLGGLAIADRLGPGETNYTRYDRDITKSTLEWLEGPVAKGDKPWVLQVGYIAPHFPLIAPKEFYALYDPADMPLPKAYQKGERPEHPWLVELRKCFVTDEAFDDDKRRKAIASYFGLISFMDDNIGQILKALEAAGLSESTDVLYLSDHGDNLGARGLWQKSTLYEESARVPMVLAGPSITASAGTEVRTGVSLVDLAPTTLDCGRAPTIKDLPGKSLIEIANAPDDPDRLVFSEYHAAGAISGSMMVRWRNWKYIHYVGFPPMLFDLETDPEELHDLGESAGHAEVRDVLEAKLRSIADPETVDLAAKEKQRALVAAHGGAEAIIADKSTRMPGGTPPPGKTTAF